MTKQRAEPKQRSGRGVRAHRAFVVSVFASVALLAVLCVSYLVFGHGFVERAWSGESAPWLREFVGDEARVPLPHALRTADERAALVLLAAVLALGVAVFVYVLVRRRRGRGLLVGAAVALWLAAEFLLAPILAVPLRLEHFVDAHDPDHWPAGRRGGRGWNADGLRQIREPEEYVEAEFNIVFLGDSFTMGLGLDRPHEEAFPHLAEAGLRALRPAAKVRTANFAWVDASPLLSLRRLRALGATYHPDLVVLCVDMSDPYDDIEWRNLIERRGLCAWYDRLPLAIGLLRLYLPALHRRLYDLTTDGNLPLHRTFHSEMPFAESEPFLAELRSNIEALATAAGDLDAGFCVLVLPRWYQFDERECPEDPDMLFPHSRHTVLGPYSVELFGWFEAWSESANFPIGSLLTDFRATEVFPTCFPDDPHWNAAGHRVAADAIVRKLLPIVDAGLSRRR